ncbi:energy transducer TonB [Reyranella sp. CPCC 100927]|uniref:TonB family protein n=1 Tax=Reyranella sp. CPCC 100927 TaxID=2599616 RepID=UPI0011B73998|nr:energy transducer TonB [Reyranella sp. CPCC 100927]TWT03888.1 energy transducer TonB [Reyranella sp. CPCC 100927]
MPGKRSIGDGTPEKWPAARPWGDLRQFLGVALCVSLLCGTGIYWLRHALQGPPARKADQVVSVRLVAPPSPPAQPVPPEKSTVPVHTPKAPAEKPAELPEPLLAKRPAEAPPALAEPKPAAKDQPARQVVKAPDTYGMVAVDFRRRLFSHLEPFRHYPEAAKPERLNGTVLLAFVMRRDGTVLDIRVSRSSGHAVLDNEAIETVRRARPFPPVPAGLPDRVTIMVPVAFSMP